MKGIKISVEEGDAFTIKGDVLALKYAQGAYGLDRDIIREFDELGLSISKKLPQEWEFYYTESLEIVKTKNIIFIGVPPLRQFGYKEIREFGRKLLISLSSSNQNIQKLILTIHGPGYGLDEIEAFKSQLAGIVDSISNGDYPKKLKEIIFVERSSGRASRMSKFVRSIFSEGLIPMKESGRLKGLDDESKEILRSAGYESESKKKIFVAMPFASEFDDIFYYGIQGAVESAGYLCERADLESFTGDVMNWVKNRIENAEYVIADLTGANPNVYLEVGYAWGKNRNTILIVKNTDELKFDVRAQKCIPYESIKSLEDSLKKELVKMKR